MQNITAHYNLLFNANELLNQKQADYAAGFVDDYQQILAVYPDTIAHSDAVDKDIDDVIIKANKIINEKEQSKYLGDAYLVIGKANYLAGSYFNAVEFFNYVIRSFPARADLKQQAFTWKARALLYQHYNEEAAVALDSAMHNLYPKKLNPAEVYAAQLQYDINTQEYEHAEEMAKQAIATVKQKQLKLRWIYILGQLQELNNKNADAIANYTRIVKSNAPFEMAFNASLNRIRIQDMHDGVKLDRIGLLLSLLKNNSNADFKDQIYYHVADLYHRAHDLPNAIKYYNLSVKSSTKNQNQKGLSYLAIADINFKERGDYITAKNYYDSVVANLSPLYPGYKQIKLKSNNLQLLVDKLKIISFEDTLQMLAKLDEDTRAAKIDAMVSNEIQRGQNLNNTVQANALTGNAAQIPPDNVTASTGSTFYFYNSAAVSKGYNDFKVKWGNRKLEDNWRVSQRAATVPANSTTTAIAGDPDALAANLPKNDMTAPVAAYRQNIMQNLPLTADQLIQSNQRVYSAYLEMANFYRDILDDKNEAIANYVLLINRYPDNPNNAEVYYDLYRMYFDSNKQLSDQYKNRLLAAYPQSIFAKVILDPNYADKVNDKDTQLKTVYNSLFNLYQRKKFAEVITKIDSLQPLFAEHPLAPQIKYLRTIAAGHRQQLAPFETSLQDIIKTYPQDKLITPLAQQHMDYINANRLTLAAMPVVLTNDDVDEIIFSSPIANKKETPFNRNRVAPVVQQTRIDPLAQKPVVPPPAIKTPATLPAQKPNQPAAVKKDSTAIAQKPVTPPAVQPEIIKKDTVVTIAKPVFTQPVIAAQPKADSAVTATSPQVKKDTMATVVPTKPKFVSNLFNERDSTHYFYVINVSTGTQDLSSSRFGIGQFNRGTYKLNSIVHRLKFAGPNNQLIFVGPFNSQAAAKAYARAITPLLPEIMKVAKDKYSFFIITQENLNKLADKNLLDSYVNYYEQTF
uniref:type IX secretion system periplasmic lipoprotein PorW/SprE n=1 Tax=Mucilaginibacter auburnensis TaxID=1457233 RepID=UPI0012FDCB95|nr:tetratricopeptide repeat protein [Mucilaginibacter auburnensis]